LKKKVLKLLKENKEGYISGGAMSKALDVSRTAIWKVINKLRNEGYMIESVSSKGYRLIDDEQLRSDEELNILLEPYTYFDEGFFYETIDSTNNVLKRNAKDKYNKNLVAVSQGQTKGKGRLGRVWESNEGLYMSYLIRPNIMPMEASIFTQIAAAAVIETFKGISNLDVRIKWPNDVVINGKKYVVY
jgi:BirA family biotin operon repressor/biotin-[acetyl-CoA-carboxylase] ligase